MSRPMQILADDNMPLLELFGRHGEIRQMPGRLIGPTDLQDVDLLLVRSVTRIDVPLLANSRLQFIGSATIGTDHLNLPLLAERGIGWANAPGCNAQAVVQYVLAALVGLVQRGRLQPLGKTASVIGVGAVGSRVAALLEALGFQVMRHDPPRAEREGAAGWVSLEQALAADVICLHAPLETAGRFPSRHLLGADQLAHLKPGAVLLNAGRGEVIDTQALSALLALRPDLSVVLDVWEQEPTVPPDLAQQVQLATPHIAGYSLEGKLQGSLMVYRACCQKFGWSESLPELTLPPLPVERASWHQPADLWSRLAALVPLTYDPWLDDARLRASLKLPPAEARQAFDRQRKDYRLRRELSALTLAGPGADALSGLGFGLAQEAV